ncbi:hypothetical protein M3Y95_00349200 [Aphelenchoides besseyi]|nr:hypothetical protein M3Y95_00349200 [Aphelenchoides besseyi]
MLNETTESLVIVGEVTEAHCKLAEALNRSSLLLSLAVTHMFISACGLVAMYKYFRTKPIRKAVGLVDTNLKIISVFGFFYYFWGFTTAMCVSLYKICIYVRHLAPCDYILSGTVCFVAYSQHNSGCTIAYTSFHIALLLERLYSTFLDPIREHPPLFGIIVGLIIFVSPQWLMFFHFYPSYVEKKFIYPRLYCAGVVNNSTASNASVLRLMITFLIIDFSVTFFDFLLLLYNKHQIAKYYQRISDTYTLTKSFSLHESRLSIRLIYPFSLTNSLSYCSLCLFFIYFLLQEASSDPEIDQFWREAINLLRTVNNFLVFFALCFVHRQQRTSPSAYIRNENEADRYFQQFNQMIA